MQTETELQRKSDGRRQAAFDKWIADPAVRMGMSMIPAGEHSDALKMLLRSAFDAGFDAGGADVGITLITAMLDKRTESKLP